MYFTLNKIQGSKPICRIVGGKYDGETVSYVDGELNLNTSMPHLLGGGQLTILKLQEVHLHH